MCIIIIVLAWQRSQFQIYEVIYINRETDNTEVFQSIYHIQFQVFSKYLRCSLFKYLSSSLSFMYFPHNNLLKYYKNEEHWELKYVPISQKKPVAEQEFKSLKFNPNNSVSAIEN